MNGLRYNNLRKQIIRQNSLHKRMYTSAFITQIHILLFFDKSYAIIFWKEEKRSGKNKVPTARMHQSFTLRSV